MSRQHNYHHTHGQSIALVALAIFVLIGVAGLGLDGANAFNQRRNAENAADAAAMAGTSSLLAQRKTGGSNAPVCQSVVDYLNQHGLNEGAGMTWTASYVDAAGGALAQVCDSGGAPVAAAGAPPADARGVAVDVKHTFETMFMRVLGRGDLTVAGDATAMYGPLQSSTSSDLVPFTVSDTALVTLTATTNPQWINISNLGEGNFGSIEFNPSNTANATDITGSDCTSSTYLDSQAYSWCNGSPQYPVYLGEVLPGNTGMVANSLSNEIATHLNEIMIVPVYSTSTTLSGGSGANAEYTIVGFLAVRLVDVQLTGNPNDRGFKVEYVSYTATAGTFSSGAQDYGVYAINLVK